MTEETKVVVRKEKEERLGWISAELGKEDSVISDLKRKLASHEGRRRELERASELLIEELELNE